MAFRTQKISQMTPKGANLEATDLIEVSTIESGSYVTRSITGQEIIDAAVGNVDWGDIGGTLSNQTDLQSALDAKVPTSRTLTINGVTQDLSANRTFTISTGITIGSTAIASGTVGRILFEGAGNVVQESSSLSYDDTAKSFTLSGNQNAITSLTISNSNTGSSAGISYALLSDTSIGNSLLYGSGRVNNNTNQYNTGASYIIDYQGPVGLNISSTFASGANSGIRFWTAASTNNGVERMRIFANGNVGIGTTTDAGFRLDVNGTARVQGNTTISLNQNATTNLGVVNTDTTNANSRARVSVTSGTIIGSISAIIGNDVYMGAESAHNLNFTTAGTTRFNINNTSGNVSIGVLASDMGARLGIKGSGNTSATKAFFAQNSSATDLFTIWNDGAIGINTSTNAGFRLDVNGTARVQNDLTIGSNRYLKAFRWTQDDVNRALTMESNSPYNFDGVNIISLNNNLLNNTKNILNLGLASTVSTQSSSSTDAFNVLNIPVTYNFTGGTHTVKGIYYNPTLTAMVGTTHFAFHSTSGNIRFENLPTSAVGLPAGTLYNNLGVLMIA